ncbi:MAG: response regulator transcription factor [Acidobacteria bacterium]|nr:response regulator transcription factor [Acidobacteriota bacterium]
MISTAQRIRVLIADDHPVVREGLSSIIDHQSDMIVAARATTGAEAVCYCGALRPDVVLMDLSMPEMDGVEATRVIHKSCPETRIFVLTVYPGDASIAHAIQAGASAYVLKSAPVEELLAAIRTVHIE